MTHRDLGPLTLILLITIWLLLVGGTVFGLLVPGAIWLWLQIL